MLEINRTDYEREKEARERRLKAYADEIQNQVRDKSREIVKELVEERHKQELTQADMAELTGMMASNIARLENGVEYQPSCATKACSCVRKTDRD